MTAGSAGRSRRSLRLGRPPSSGCAERRPSSACRAARASSDDGRDDEDLLPDLGRALRDPACRTRGRCRCSAASWRAVGIDRERAVELRQRLVRLVHVVVGDAEIGADVDVLRMDRQRLLVPVARPPGSGPRRNTCCRARRGWRRRIGFCCAVVLSADARASSSGGRLPADRSTPTRPARPARLTLAAAARTRRPLLGADDPADQQAEEHARDADDEGVLGHGRLRSICESKERLLSILVVNFNTRDWLRDCLSSLFATLPAGTFEVLVLDNASADDSIAKAKRLDLPVRWTLLDRNVGFAQGNNELAAQAAGDFICLLNPDTTLTADCLTPLVEFLARPSRRGHRRSASSGRGWSLAADVRRARSRCAPSSSTRSTRRRSGHAIPPTVRRRRSTWRGWRAAAWCSAPSLMQGPRRTVRSALLPQRRGRRLVPAGPRARPALGLRARPRPRPLRRRESAVPGRRAAPHLPQPRNLFQESTTRCPACCSSAWREPCAEFATSGCARS